MIGARRPIDEMSSLCSSVLSASCACALPQRQTIAAAAKKPAQTLPVRGVEQIEWVGQQRLERRRRLHFDRQVRLFAVPQIVEELFHVGGRVGAGDVQLLSGEGLRRL